MLTPASLPKLDPLPEPTLMSVLMDLETEPLLLDSHISLMGIECEIKFFDLDSTLEPKLTPEPKVDFPELVLVPTFHFKTQIIYSTKSHSIVGPRY